ncbi:MAG: hypothetical protein CSA11_09140 [Chloroflexi bacterium]|nr:MAG: hypothetical protein CSB13_05265 [Chloroflexota bacterium]PIE80284.1 MAG: hypothetical protein CSA11_09140 [Chloroflexota bacterium]
MALSALGALIFTGLSLVGQSPKFLARAKLQGVRLDSRVRMFTGYGFACVLLGFGFFLAGVPLNGTPLTEQTAVLIPTPTAKETTIAIVGSSVTTPTPSATNTAEFSRSGTPASGAFVGLPAAEGEDSTSIAGTESEADSSAAAVTPLTETSTQTNTPTPTPTATPTSSPTPTLTPTPIVGETAVVDLGGSTIWLRNTPGGQKTIIINSGDIVILLDRHANRAGHFWREVSTVKGVRGWLPVEFLSNQ